MPEGKLEFLDETPAEEPKEVEAVAEEPQAEPTPEPEVAEAEAAPEEAEAVDAEAEPEPEGKGETPEAAPPVAAEEKQQSVPITALLDEREKRQKAEREAEQLRQWRQQMQAKQQPKPDFFENPEQAIQQAVMASKLETSRALAEEQLGKERVAEAVAYFDEHPQESHRFLQNPLPFHAAVKFVEQQKFLQEVQDPDAWREAERERIKQELLAEMPVAQPSPSPAAPPPSVAKAPAQKQAAIAPGNAFDNMFEG